MMVYDGSPMFPTRNSQLVRSTSEAVVQLTQFNGGYALSTIRHHSCPVPGFRYDSNHSPLFQLSRPFQNFFGSIFVVVFQGEKRQRLPQHPISHGYNDGVCGVDRTLEAGGRRNMQLRPQRFRVTQRSQQLEESDMNSFGW